MSRVFIVIPEEWLRKEYIDKGRSATSIANELGCNSSSVLRQLGKYNIPCRTEKEAQDLWLNKHRRKITYKVTEKGCWECISHHNNVTGYPVININRVEMRLSRFIYAKTHKITLESMQGLVVMHTCDNPKCINPDHLILGTNYDNSQDMKRKMRQMHGEGHYRAILKESDIGPIRKSKLTCKELGRIYGISASAIRSVKLRRNWKYV